MQPETPQQAAGMATSTENATLANQLLLIGQAIAIATTKDQIIIFASYIKLIAAFLFIRAVALEEQEQQIAPGVTTPLNRLKMTGTVVSTIGAIILIYVLQRESALRAQGIGPTKQPLIPPFSGPAFI